MFTYIKWPHNAQLGNNLKGVPSLLFTNNTAQIEAASDSMGVPSHFFLYDVVRVRGKCATAKSTVLIKYIVNVN